MTILDKLILTSETGNNKTLTAYSFVVFIDETGHEKISDDNYPIYGLGGCAVLVANYREYIAEPWLQLKKDHFGTDNIPLHASSYKKYDKKQLIALGEFFKNSLFCRVASILTDRAELYQGLLPIRIITSSLMDRIGDVAGKWDRSEVVLIFEESSRTDKLMARYFREYNKLKVVRNGIKSLIPVKKYKMPKNSLEPGLEIADFIMHAAGGQVRAWRKNCNAKLRKDFDAVFNHRTKNLASFKEVLNVEVNNG